jgi:hypothetical protein
MHLVEVGPGNSGHKQVCAMEPACVEFVMFNMTMPPNDPKPYFVRLWSRQPAS